MIADQLPSIVERAREGVALCDDMVRGAIAAEEDNDLLRYARDMHTGSLFGARFRKDKDVIKLFRIDHRLLHGQVGFSWVRSIGADCILIADDDSATDSLKMATLRLAKPQGIKLVVKTIDDSIKAIKSGATDKYKLFIVTGSVKDAKRICDEIPEIQSIQPRRHPRNREWGPVR